MSGDTCTTRINIANGRHQKHGRNAVSVETSEPIKKECRQQDRDHCPGNEIDAWSRTDICTPDTSPFHAGHSRSRYCLLSLCHFPLPYNGISTTSIRTAVTVV